ncbi:tyrosine-protein phosphatase [Zhouia sp. PK063]|uniref:tyrosine-protein phosphatase n=1 Tax=Zhouia sp. PK063 TaxID=3373602 RepID=UPI003796B0B5
MFSIFTPKQFLVDLIDNSIDIHNHLLPGIDDGSPTIENTLNMIASFKEIGYAGAYATPHIMEGFYDNTSDIVINTYQQTNTTLEDQKVDFNFNFAAEYMVDSSFSNLVGKRDLLYLNNTHILIEMSYFNRSLSLEDEIFRLQNIGVQPILAHPERYGYIKTVEEFEEIKDLECKLQLNILSLTQHYGTTVQKMAYKLLEKGYYDFIGTDAHKMAHLEKIKQIKIEKKHAHNLKRLFEKNKTIFG